MKKLFDVSLKLKALGYSLEGLKMAMREELSFRQELILSLVLIPLAFYFDISAVEQALLIASLMLVLIVELLNSAVEAVVDRISDEIHPLSKKAKDTGSAAVFIALLNAGAVWGVILLPW